jgi:hypothetical protein
MTKKIITVFTIFCFLMLLFVNTEGVYASTQSTYYVSPSGNDSWDGLSASFDGIHGPFATISRGLVRT